MKLQFNPKLGKTDLFVLFLEKNEKEIALPKGLPKDLEKSIQARLKAKDFSAEEGETLTLHDLDGFKKIMLFGTGEAKDRLPTAELKWGGSLAKLVKGSASVTLALKSEWIEPVLYGLNLGRYEFKRYQKVDPKKDKKPELQQVTIWTDMKQPKTLEAEWNAHASQSTHLRDLVNTPTGDLNTKDMADEARKIAKKFKLKFTELSETQLKKLGCGAIVGVGQGATERSRMIILEYKNSSAKNPQLALIGKGIVFDSGGLNLKPTGHIETMKEDMTGSATVMAAIATAAELKLKGHFIAVLCLAENAVSDRSVHPGDVLKAYNGKTIEITNTDAEGRLVLADGLSYTEKNYKPERMIDIATLTGAVVVALGYDITGVMSNDEEFQNVVCGSAKDCDERVWTLPLTDDFMKACKGNFSDLQNSTRGHRADSSMAAAFLKHFVEKTPWVHLDIAGTSWAEKPNSLSSYGATAWGLRTLVDVMKKVGK